MTFRRPGEEFGESAASGPFFVDLEGACQVLAEIGICLSLRQMQRAAEPDGTGRRKLPFFVDPIDGRLKIERATLLQIYLDRQKQAESASTLDL